MFMENDCYVASVCRGSHLIPLSRTAAVLRYAAPLQARANLHQAAAHKLDPIATEALAILEKKLMEDVSKDAAEVCMNISVCWGSQRRRCPSILKVSRYELSARGVGI